MDRQSYILTASHARASDQGGPEVSLPRETGAAARRVHSRWLGVLALAVAGCSASAPAVGSVGATIAATPVQLVPSPAPPAESPVPLAESPTPAPSVLPSLPATPDGPVPADLQPSLGAAPEDYPVTFSDGCNVPEGGSSSRGLCLYGNLSSKTTIALFGDSHAAFWFPAIEGLAQRQGWRLLNLTMSSCTPADLSVYNSTFKRIYTECPAWREQAIARLVAMHPAVIVLAGTHGISPVDPAGRPITGDALVGAWEAGMARTLERLIPAAGRVILMADTPTSRFDPPACLSQHRASVLACATPVEKAIDEPWLAAERQVVAQTGVGFIDPTYWVCPTSPCPAVVGNLLVYQNAGHLSATYAAALTDRLGAAILDQMGPPSP
jgi:SGNH domain (fused to AT3 domains)